MSTASAVTGSLTSNVPTKPQGGPGTPSGVAFPSTTESVASGPRPDPHMAQAQQLSNAAKTMAEILPNLMPMGNHDFTAKLALLISANASVQRTTTAITIQASAMGHNVNVSITGDDQRPHTVDVKAGSKTYTATLKEQGNGIVATSLDGKQTLTVMPAGNGFTLTPEGFPEIPSFVHTVTFKPK